MTEGFIKKLITVFSVVFVSNFVAIYVLTKPLGLEAKKVISLADIDTSNFLEENNSLDASYRSVVSEIEKYTKEKKAPKQILIEESSIFELPKLAIIMDDVGFYRHVDSIKRVPFPITPSIFPPNKIFPNTVMIAKEFTHYMVHFPMEAYNYKNSSENVLNISDSIDVFESSIEKLSKDFPSLLAINNHTGSKFTGNYKALKQFFSILDKYNYDFVDSKTTNKSLCSLVGKEYNKKVLQRDVFLDNEVDVSKIRDRLKEAVKIAKRNGQAIAICHPKIETFKALRSSKDILKDVELVYIDELL